MDLESDTNTNLTHLPAVVDDGGEIQIGTIRLQVVPGDITQETTDAIVNITNAQLRFSLGSYLDHIPYFL